ncbi:MAG: hypothetical protein ABR975_05850 [Vulcanimicrobiaceae bacterium]
MPPLLLAAPLALWFGVEVGAKDALNDGGRVERAPRALLAALLYRLVLHRTNEVHFEARADGGWRISTPGEDYVAIPLGGGAVWIGSEREYTDQTVRGWATDHGFRADTTHPNTFYLKATKRAFMPTLTLDGIATLIDPGDLQVDINWTESAPKQVGLFLLDQRTHAVYKPVGMDLQGGIHDETFKLPRAALRDRMLMFFFASRTDVAAVSVPSLAREAYAILAEQQKLAPSAKDQRTMAALHVLDPSIP